MTEEEFNKKKAYLESLAVRDCDVRSYDFDDRDDCYVDGCIFAVYDKFVVIEVFNWVVNGKPARNFTSSVVPRIEFARIVPLEQIYSMADAGMSAMMFMDEAEGLEQVDREMKAKRDLKAYIDSVKGEPI